MDYHVLDENLIEVDEPVRVNDGPLTGLEGVLVGVVEARGLGIVELRMMNRPTRVSLEYWQLERIGTRDQDPEEARRAN